MTVKSLKSERSKGDNYGRFQKHGKETDNA